MLYKKSKKIYFTKSVSGINLPGNAAALKEAHSLQKKIMNIPLEKTRKLKIGWQIIIFAGTLSRLKESWLLWENGKVSKKNSKNHSSAIETSRKILFLSAIIIFLIRKKWEIGTFLNIKSQVTLPIFISGFRKKFGTGVLFRVGWWSFVSEYIP